MPPAWKEHSGYAYQASNQSLRAVLEDFARANGVTLAMNGLQEVTVNGRMHAASPQEFLDKLALTYRFDWFVYNFRLYVNPAGSHVTERVAIGQGTASDVKQALLGVGLLEDKFGWGELQDAGAVLVSGPREYVDLVKHAIAVSTEDTQSRPMMFRLNYAFLEDREITFRDKVKVIPGVTTVLRKLLGDNREENNDRLHLRGANETASPNNGTPFSLQLNDAPETPKRGTVDARRVSMTEKQMLDEQRKQERPIVEADVRTNSIIIRDDPSKREYYRGLIEQLDVPQRLVEIEALIVDVERNKMKDLGIDWSVTFGQGNGKTSVGGNTQLAGTSAIDGIAALGALNQAPAAGAGASLLINNAAHLYANLRALEGEGEAAVLARPAVMTMENLGAVIDLNQTVYIKLIGERTANAVPVTAGTTLRVTPSLIGTGSDARVQMMIDIEDGVVSQNNDNNGNSNPAVQRNTISTQAIVDSGKSLVVGGYSVQGRNNMDQGVPGLRSLPLVGRLFDSKSDMASTRERIFIITPHAVDLAAATQRADTLGKCYAAGGHCGHDDGNQGAQGSDGAKAQGS